MENASKAIIMAGEMLIAILVASILVGIFSIMSEYSRSYEEKLTADEIQAFNTQFTKYSDNATLQDIITLQNLAESYREKGMYNIQITIEGTPPDISTEYGTVTSTDPTDPTKSIVSMQKYTGTVTGYDEDGRINGMNFTSR